MDVLHVAKLANLNVTTEEIEKFSAAFTRTLSTIDLINELDTSSVLPTSQVTGLTNVSRPDIVDPSRVLTQSQALSPTTSTRDGYFVVPAVFDAQ